MRYVFEVGVMPLELENLLSSDALLSKIFKSKRITRTTLLQ